MQLESFLTIKEESVKEIIVERSRFIANSFLAEDEETAIKKLSLIKKSYYGVSHNCYAFVLSPSSNITRHCDDKEPSKTAGYPILEAIKSKKLFNTLVIVTRYFGGIKLGMGGLSRAYHDAATLVLDGSNVTKYTYCAAVNIKTEYCYIAAVKRLTETYAEICEENFNSDINLKAFCPLSCYNELIEKLSSVTAGTAVTQILNYEYYPIKNKI